MPQRVSPLKALEARKKLLTAQAELQRLQIRQDLEMISENLHRLGARAKSASTIFSIAQAAFTTFSAFRRRSASGGRGNGRSFLFSSVLGGARVAMSLWKVLRPH